MLDLNCSDDGKPRDLTVTVTKTFWVHTCSTEPVIDVIMAYDDDHFDELTPDEETLKINGKTVRRYVDGLTAELKKRKKNGRH